MSARAIALLCLLPLAVVLGRDQLEGRAALREADALAERADPEAVERRVDALERAARRLAGPAGAARAALAALGRAGVAPAWPALRGAILETRWLVTPDAALLDEANQAIARALAQRKLASAGSPPASAALAAETAAQLARLRATGEPSRALALVAVGGLAAFLFGLGRVLVNGRSPRALALAGLGLVALVVGLWRA